MPIHAHALQATQATALKWCQDENQELRQELHDLKQEMERLRGSFGLDLNKLKDSNQKLREENKTLKQETIKRLVDVLEGVPPPPPSVLPAPQ